MDDHKQSGMPLAAQKRHASSSWATCLTLSCLILVIISNNLWADAFFNTLQKLAAQRYGQQAEETVSDWQNMIQSAKNMSDIEKLEQTNTFFNRRIRFAEDIVVWGKQDYWATPLETMGKGAGDCEDFSIAKYATLQLLGIPIEKLRLIYVRAQMGAPDSGITQAHMVMGYYTTFDSEPLILDNLISDIWPASKRKDLYPVFSFNSIDLRVNGAPQTRADPTARLSPWRDVVDRMRRDGFE